MIEAYLAWAIENSTLKTDQIDLEAIMCLSHAIHHEARGEGVEGQVAVGWVVINRSRVLGRYGDTICDVVYSPKQFSGIDKQMMLKIEYSEATMEVATLVYAGWLEDPTDGALYYYAHDGLNALSRDPWPQMTAIADIGNHRFKKP